MRYGFEGVVVDTDTYEVQAGDRVVKVEPQVFDVLALLIAHRDRVVTKDELLDGVWGDRFVSESALTTRIKQARQAVGDDGQAQRVIKTVHGRGYRFVAPVEALDVTATAPQAGVAAGHDRPAARPGIDDEAGSALAPTPPTRYVTNDGASIAYQVFGEGPDLVLIEGFATNVEVQWEHPAIARFLRRLGSFCRVAVLDKRGTGLSERVGPGEVPPLEQRADDVRAVMDAAGMSRATVFGSSEGGSLCVLLAAAHPERVERLVLHGTWARHPWWRDADRREMPWIERAWGTGTVYARLAESMAATAAGRRFLARFERQGATPVTARRLAEMMRTIDVTPLLPSVSVPTLVLHRDDDPVYVLDHGRDLAAGIPDARLVVLPGRDHLLFSGDTEPILAAVEEFVAGGATGPAAPDRFLATVLAVDLVDPAGGGLADAGLAEACAPALARCVGRHGGELAVTGGRAVAVFDGPGRAVRTACDLRRALAPLGAEVRAGVHTAEIERHGGAVSGLGVDIAARVAEVAELGSVWVSRTVTDLVAGTGLVLEPRGEHRLAGVAEPWVLFEVAA